MIMAGLSAYSSRKINTFLPYKRFRSLDNFLVTFAFLINLLLKFLPQNLFRCLNLICQCMFRYEAQSNQLVEECAELIQAVNKYRRVETGLGQPVAEDKKAIARDNLVEEIADVELMLEQVKYLLQIPEDELLAVKTFKVNRTRERMESSK